MNILLTLLLLALAGTAQADPPDQDGLHNHAGPPDVVCCGHDHDHDPAEPAELIDLDSEASVFAQCFTDGRLVLEVEGIKYRANGRRLMQADRRIIYLPEGCTVADRTRVR